MDEEVEVKGPLITSKPVSLGPLKSVPWLFRVYVNVNDSPTTTVVFADPVKVISWEKPGTNMARNPITKKSLLNTIYILLYTDYSFQFTLK